MLRRLLLTATGALALAAWGSESLPGKFDATRDAAADLQHALELARQQGKLVLLDVGGEWCTWCHVFDRFVASRPDVLQALRQRYILLKVNYSPQNRNEAVLSRWPKAPGYPHFFVLDAGGKLLASQRSSDLEAGEGYDEARVLAFLRQPYSSRSRGSEK